MSFDWEQMRFENRGGPVHVAPVIERFLFFLLPVTLQIGQGFHDFRLSNPNGLIPRLVFRVHDFEGGILVLQLLDLLGLDAVGLHDLRHLGGEVLGFDSVHGYRHIGFVKYGFHNFLSVLEWEVFRGWIFVFHFGISFLYGTVNPIRLCFNRFRPALRPFCLEFRNDFFQLFQGFGSANLFQRPIVPLCGLGLHGRGGGLRGLRGFGSHRLRRFFHVLRENLRGGGNGKGGVHMRPLLRHFQDGIVLIGDVFVFLASDFLAFDCFVSFQEFASTAAFFGEANPASTVFRFPLNYVRPIASGALPLRLPPAEFRFHC